MTSITRVSALLLACCLGAAAQSMTTSASTTSMVPGQAVSPYDGHNITVKGLPGDLALYSASIVATSGATTTLALNCLQTSTQTLFGTSTLPISLCPTQGLTITASSDGWLGSVTGSTSGQLVTESATASAAQSSLYFAYEMRLANGSAPVPEMFGNITLDGVTSAVVSVTAGATKLPGASTTTGTQGPTSSPSGNVVGGSGSSGAVNVVIPMTVLGSAVAAIGALMVLL